MEVETEVFTFTRRTLWLRCSRSMLEKRERGNRGESSDTPPIRRGVSTRTVGWRVQAAVASGAHYTSLGPWGTRVHCQCRVSPAALRWVNACATMHSWDSAWKAVSFQAFVMTRLREVVDFLKPLNRRACICVPTVYQPWSQVGFITWQQDKYSDEALHSLTKAQASGTNLLTPVASLGQHLKIREVCLLAVLDSGTVALCGLAPISFSCLLSSHTPKTPS